MHPARTRQRQAGNQPTGKQINQYQGETEQCETIHSMIDRAGLAAQLKIKGKTVIKAGGASCLLNARECLLN